MGREIRRVPADWEHPRYSENDAPHSNRVGDYRPLYDDDYESVAERWLSDLAIWSRGEHPGQPCSYGRYFWEYDGTPDKESYRERKWAKAEATHFQAYETVSEGTPVTPHFATKQELIDHLVEIGDARDQLDGAGGWLRENAEAFVAAEWAVSLVVTRSDNDVEIKAPRDGQF